MNNKGFMNISRAVGVIAIIAIIFVACSKQRITQDTYSPMDSFYNDNQQQEQEYQVDSGGTPPCIITGKMGTRLLNLCDKSMFVRKKDGSSIYYPYKIRLTEVYTVKDIILSRVPTIGGGNILESEAELRIRAFKDADELNYLSGNYYGIALAPSPKLLSSPQVFYGLQPTGFIDWALAGDSVSAAFPDSTGAFNDMIAGKIDWVQSAKPHITSAANTTIKINAIGNNTQNIDVYIIFKSFKSVMRVTNLQSGQVPVGENVTVIAMALNQNNDYLLHQEDIIVSAGQQITLNFKTVTSSSLLSTLAGF